MYEVVFYGTENGRSPAAEFIDGLQPKMKAKVLRTIDLLEQYGPSLREPYSKSLNGGIFELRIKLGSDISRVLYFFFIGKKVVLTNGFIKKTKKTPSEVIETAKKYKIDYERRNGKGAAIVHTKAKFLAIQPSKLNTMRFNRNTISSVQ